MKWNTSFLTCANGKPREDAWLPEITVQNGYLLVSLWFCLRANIHEMTSHLNLPDSIWHVLSYLLKTSAFGACIRGLNHSRYFRRSPALQCRSGYRRLSISIPEWRVPEFGLVGWSTLRYGIRQFNDLRTPSIITFQERRCPEAVMVLSFHVKHRPDAHFLVKTGPSAGPILLIAERSR